MKNNFVAAVIAMTLATAGNAFAADGTVEFSGTITDTACTIVTPSIVVDFGTVASSAFANIGDVAAAKSFEIAVTNCPASKATIRFDAESVPFSTDLFSIGQASTADGVAISLFDSEGTKIFPNNNTNVHDLPANAKKVFPFTAKLESTASPVKAGDILASADFTIVYQ